MTVAKTLMVFAVAYYLTSFGMAVAATLTRVIG